MLPVLFKIGPVPLHSYGLMIAIGFLLALHFIQKEAARANLNTEVMANAALYSLLIGIAGTRLLHIVMFPGDYRWTDPVGWIAVWRGGLVFQGGPPPVILFLAYYFRKHKVDYWKAVDIAAPYVALGHAFGRIGCFLNGCCYGRRTDSIFGVAFRRVPWDVSLPPTGSPAYLDHLSRYSDLTTQDHWSHPVHPTQIYESLSLFLIFALLLLLRRRWHPFQGSVVSVYLVLYGTARFFIEIFRGDNNPVRFGLPLSDQQILSLLFIFVGVVLYLILRAWSRRGGSRAGGRS